MGFAIFAVVVVLLTALFIWLVFKIKSTAARIILTIVLVVGAIITLVVGGLVFGAAWLGQEFGEAVQEEIEREEQEQEQSRPRNADGELKDTFTQSEIVRGNGAEVEVLRAYTIEDNKDLEFIENVTYCAVDFRFKNLFTTEQSFFASNFTLEETDGNKIYSAILLDDEFANTFDSFTVDLQPEQEITKSLAYDCAGKTDLVFEYDGGFLLFNTFLTEDEFLPIQIEVEF
jgi:hypothetical protein